MLCVQRHSYRCIFWDGKGEIHMQHKTKHAARKIQIDRQLEKTTYTHDIDSWRQANTEGLCVRETKTIIGKAPRLGIHTLKCHAAVRPCGSFSERNIWGTHLNKVFFHDVWRVWLWVERCERWVWGGGCERWVRGWVGRLWLGWKGECSVVVGECELWEVACLCVGEMKCLGVCVALFLLNWYWGIFTVPGSFLKARDLG